MKRIINILTIVFGIVFVAYFGIDYIDEKEPSLPPNTTIIKDDNCLLRCPVSLSEHNLLLNHEIFIASYNTETKFSDWVAYRVIDSNLGGDSRPRNWASDPKLPELMALQPKDFRGLNADPLKFDRGHQAPLSSFKNNSNWHKTNYLSNITPQKAALNQGPWKRLENKVRKIAKKYQTVYVVTGVYYSQEFTLTLPNARLAHTIPAGYWKIIAVDSNDQIYLSAFLMPQETERRANYCEYLVDINEIAQKTKLEFFNKELSGHQSLDNSLGCI